MKRFTIPERLMEALRGVEHVTDYITSQMLVNGFDINKPYRTLHDRANRRWVVEQEEAANADPVVQ